MNHRALKASTGFTLLELMTAIAVLGVLLAIGVPSFRDAIANNRTTTQANTLVSALNLARSEASKRGMAVSLCTAEDDDGDACGDDTDWSRGWILFTDAIGVAGQIDAGAPADEILQRFPAADNNIALDSSGSSFIRFSPRGEAINGAATTFTVTHSGCTGDNQRRLTVDAVGRVSTAREACP